MTGDVVTWTVAVCPKPPADAPPDAPIGVYTHTRRGRVVEVTAGGVLVEPLPIDAYPPADRGREFYVSLQPAGLAPMWLCEGQYRRVPPTLRPL